MADRSIVVKLRADVADFDKSMAQAAKSTEKIGKGAEDAAKKSEGAFGRLKRSATENRAAWNTAGTTLTAFGAASVGALGLATKAAMDWESAWAGVTKTVDGTPAQLAAIEDGLRGMTRELPASHQEIAAVAEAAGALGVKSEDILGFTRTMINLGETTNISSEDAATSLARFMNIMGTASTDVERLGSTLVGLGNSGASTEQEIMDLGLRLAGAGAQAGLSEGEILGMANALSSVGIEAESGGSAMSMTMKRIGKAADEGGSSLDLFAQVAGMSAEQFATTWETRPAEAMSAFVEGLGRTEEMGMSTNAVLTELGITGIRESDALLRMSAAGDILATSMGQGNEEFSKGNALIEEASKRYETAESKIQLAKNALVDAGISIGGVVLPALSGLAEGVADVAGWFADLPAPVHAVLGGLAGVAGAASLGAGSFLLLFPRVLDTVQGFRDLGVISGTTATKVGRAGLAIGKIGLGLGVAAAAFPLVVSGARALEDSLKGIDRGDLDLGMNQLTSNLLEAVDSGDAFDSILGDLYDSGAVTTKSFADLGEAVSGVSNLSTDGWAKTGKALNLTNSDLKALEDRFASTGEALVMMSQTDLPSAQAAFSEFWAEAEAGGATFDETMRVLPGFKDALTGIATEMGVGSDNATLLKIATGELAPAVDEATGAITGFEEGVEGAAEATATASDAATEYYDSITELANAFITSEQAAMDYADAIDEANKAVDENGKAWEDGTEAADANKTALLDLATQALATADTFKDDNSSGTFLKTARDDLIEVATEMMGSKEAAEEYVDQLLATPEEIQTQIDLDTAAASEKWEALWEELGYNPPAVPVDADTELAEGKMTGLVSDVPPVDVPVDADTAAATEGVGAFIGATDASKGTVGVWADVQPALGDVTALEGAIDASGGTVTINGNEVPADHVLDTLMGIINNSDGTVTIDGNKYPADQALGAAIAAINRSGGTVDIDGNNAGARGATDNAVGHANSSSGSIKVNANASSANSAINNAARTRTARINVTYSDPGFKGGGGSSRFATGGAVQGPGSWTSDSIPALLSNGEHVITAAEVARAGGQDAIYRMRAAINSGLKFADGGGVENGSYARSPVIRNQVMRPSSSDGSNVGGQIAAAMSSWQPIVNIDGREFAGLMQQGNQRIKSMGGRR